jgi:SAM-dependent methyltransferase
MAYYDRIANQWHSATGYRGGAFKEYVLNDLLLEKIPGVGDRAILELGAGNGYFLPMLVQRYSGQRPSSVTITDGSRRLLELAEARFGLSGAVYQVLDVRRPFPLADGSMDLVLATFVFNEVPNKGSREGASECYRVLSPGGLFLMTVTHPDFVNSLNRRGLLRRSGGLLTMPGAADLRLPVVRRSVETYRGILANSGFHFEEEDVYPNDKVLNAKPGLKEAGNVPLALLFTCTRPARSQGSK